MKKILQTILIIVLVLSLSGCGELSLRVEKPNSGGSAGGNANGSDLSDSEALKNDPDAFTVTIRYEGKQYKPKKKDERQEPLFSPAGGCPVQQDNKRCQQIRRKGVRILEKACQTAADQEAPGTGGNAAQEERQQNHGCRGMRKPSQHLHPFLCLALLKRQRKERKRQKLQRAGKGADHFRGRFISSPFNKTYGLLRNVGFHRKAILRPALVFS